MLPNRKPGWLLLVVAVCCGSGTLAQVGEHPAYLAAALASPARPPLQMARDAAGRPGDVVAFARIAPGQVVADLVPADGYFTRILSKVVGSAGRVYAFVPQRGYPNIQQQRAAEQKQRLEGGSPQPNSLDLVLPLQHATDYRNVTVILANLMAYGGNFGVPDQLDTVFTAHGYGALRSKVDGPVNNAPLDMLAVNRAIFRALKPGGLYVVVEETSVPGVGSDIVRQEMQAAGFIVDGEGTLAPDRVMLRFKKPSSASAATKRLPLSVMKNYFGNTFVLGTPDQRFRTIFYHEDGSFQEFGLNDMQLARHYFDADGHNCMYHEAPAEQEGFVTCHPFAKEHIDAKVGDVWVEEGGGPQGTRVSLVKGYQYPNTSRLPPPKD